MINNLKEQLLHAAAYLGKDEFESFKTAIEFAEQAHSGQKRATGEPYIIHPYIVCKILMNYQADVTTLVSSLLHDVAEDTHYSITDIESRFGAQVAAIVNGLTKLEKGVLEKEEYSASNFEKLLTASADDIRVAIVKIADRLHNMRTLQVKKAEKQVPYSNETLVFFSPLAERLGLFEIQKELEELSFSYLNPKKYQGVRQLLDNYRLIFAQLLEQSSEKIKAAASPDIPLEIGSLDAPIYKSYSLLQDGAPLSDIFTVEVVTDQPLQCYTALGVIHSLFQPVERKFQDHLAVKKGLFSAGLATKVLIEDREVKIEIKPKGVKKTQQYGVFSLLKRGLSEVEVQQLSREVLRDSIDSVKSISGDPVEFYNLISFELLQRDITVFTPRMDAIALPDGSTAIDFAFHLNPQLARKMSGVKINGERASLSTLLKDMDIVEIQPGKEDWVGEDWFNHAHTSKSQQEIMKILSKRN
jgi:GTP diphosphokinase / guanosine-3',5'-bis(diphosphate) 3'-diphosphatase